MSNIEVWDNKYSILLNDLLEELESNNSLYEQWDYFEFDPRIKSIVKTKIQEAALWCLLLKKQEQWK